MLRNFFAREDRSVEGQTLVEYALIIVLVSIAAVLALTTLGTTVSGVFDTIVGELGGGEAAQ